MRVVQTRVEVKFFRISHPFSVKKVFLEFSQYSQENTSARAWNRCFPVNFVKFLRTPFLTEHLWWLLLIFVLHLPLSHYQKLKVYLNNAK